MQSEEESEPEEDVVQLLDQAEALELIEFDPTVDHKDTWKPPQAIQAFLEKHFNRSLSEEERSAIMKDFPKPQCGIMSAPKLDEEVEEQLKMRGKDPHYGSEKSLYKLQEQVLYVAGPLTCLWSDLLNKEAKVSNEDVLQRALVLLGSVSHTISLEKRKIAWARINPQLKSLASEEYYDKRETNLFGPGFMEKASKRIEADKTIAKVVNASKGPPPAKKRKFSSDKSDFRHFFDRGASARYGSKKEKRHQPYTNFTKSQSSKYFHKPGTSQQPASKGNSPKANWHSLCQYSANHAFTLHILVYIYAQCQIFIHFLQQDA